MLLVGQWWGKLNESNITYKTQVKMLIKHVTYTYRAIFSDLARVYIISNSEITTYANLVNNISAN